MNIHEMFFEFCKSHETAVQFSEKTKSTNDDAKAEATKTKEPLKIYVTGHQELGRGRGKNSWENSTSGSALLCSFSFALTKPAQPIAAPLFGLAVYDALQTAFPTLNFSLKAPNDILLAGQKCAGILMEAVQAGSCFRLIAGIGINFFECPPSIEDSTCLAKSNRLSKTEIIEFFGLLKLNTSRAALASQAPHLTQSERRLLLQALNRNPNLPSPYLALSPFGDLTSAEESISWKDL